MAEPNIALETFFAEMIRVAYAEGFRSGAHWVHDHYNTEAQVQAFDFEEKHRDSTQAGLIAILATMEGEG